jgi:hydroxymethylpyrimidine/phosphomethylpyrimidine kinase
MLGDAGTAAAVARALAATKAPIVWDPVLRPSRGDVVLTKGDLAPLLAIAACVTPNLDEASAIVGFPVATEEDMLRAAIHGPCSMLIKGGHLPGAPVDILGINEVTIRYGGERIEGGPFHGTGCVLSTAIACGLARRRMLVDAVGEARTYQERKLREAFAVGGGARCLV